MNKKIFLLLVPIFFSVWWMVTPQATYVTYYWSDGWYYKCGYTIMPTALEVFGLHTHWGGCDVLREYFHENHQVINNRWECTGEMCDEFKKIREERNERHRD